PGAPDVEEVPMAAKLRGADPLAGLDQVGERESGRGLADERRGNDVLGRRLPDADPEHGHEQREDDERNDEAQAAHPASPRVTTAGGTAALAGEGARAKRSRRSDIASMPPVAMMTAASQMKLTS